MNRSAPRESYVVVALFEPIDVGTSIARKRWPAHVTLAPNFFVDGTVDELVAAVRGAGSLTEPMVLTFAGRALFGPNRDVPVRLVRSTRVSGVHRRLADQLETLPGFAAEEPAFWRHGYRPHLTLRPTIAVREGDSLSACCIAIARLGETEAEIVAELGMLAS